MIKRLNNKIKMIVIRPAVMKVNMEKINLMMIVMMMMMIESKYRKRCKLTGRSNKMKK